ncbi:MAG: tRNA (adenosine(37)-N6)-threonylcarbamoyltransferase complex dimerization subunit type 1 TsaB [Micrococcales bacterium]
MTYLLSIDTTNGTSVAIHHDGETVVSIHHDSGMKHAELIGNTIKTALSEAKLAPHQLTAVAVGRGPGLFTGLRVGIAAAIMFAEAIDKPLFGVISLDAIALQNYESKQIDLPLLIHTDARRGEVNWALYDGLDSHQMPKRIAGPAVGKFDAVVNEIRDIHSSIHEVTGGATADYIGKLADLQLKAAQTSKDVSALYLRAPDAALPKPNQPFGKRVSG